MIENTAIQTGPNPRIDKQYQSQDAFSSSRRKQEVTAEDYSLLTDKVSLSYNSESVTTYDSTMSLRGTHNDGFDLLRGLVLNMFKEQGLSLNIAVGTTGNGVEEINIGEITPEEANELIADDGYFGVEQTSDRIVDFAISIAGGDPARIDAIKAGVEQGFNEAFKAFGDWLPDISYDTYDTVMEKLDAWVKDTTEIQA
jgi:hypothetical protein